MLHVNLKSYILHFLHLQGGSVHSGILIQSEIFLRHSLCHTKFFKKSKFVPRNGFLMINYVEKRYNTCSYINVLESCHFQSIRVSHLGFMQITGFAWSCQPSNQARFSLQTHGDMNPPKNYTLLTITRFTAECIRVATRLSF